MNSASYECDVLIFGCGISGLWLLNSLSKAGYSVIALEAHSIGAGQTIACQGVIHSGLKYTCAHAPAKLGQHLAAMPAVWRHCLAGDGPLDLRGVSLRSRTNRFWSDEPLDAAIEAYAKQTGCSRSAEPVVDSGAGIPVASYSYRVDEPIFDVPSVLSALAEDYRERIWLYDPAELALLKGRDGAVTEVHLSRRRVRILPRTVILAAGAGIPFLRHRLNLNPLPIQLRPLDMVLLAGALPEVYGNYFRKGRQQVAITAVTSKLDQPVWLLGGDISEDRSYRSGSERIRGAGELLQEVIPGFQPHRFLWSTYFISRFEPAARSSARPDDATVVAETNVMTVWPAKFGLTPRLAEKVHALLPKPAGISSVLHRPGDVETPRVAPCPWDRFEWQHYDGAEFSAQSKGKTHAALSAGRW